MKFTLSWLKDHLETEATLDEIVAALTDIGLEVEDIVDPAERLGVFRICRVIEAVQHPNADRLRVCRVEAWVDGPDKPSQEVQVVCGAPNARTGLVGVFAPPGSYVPGIDMTLKPGKIRDVESNGMLCSERELEVSEEHDGIVDLPADAPLGARFIDYKGLNDPMIEIAITPNRPDALGVRGIARDLAARGLGTVKPDPLQPIPGTFDSPIKVTLADEVADKACPLFVGRMVRGLKNGPSPDWMQARLKSIGLRPINKLVDITNYLTFDRARPLHVFDAAKVQGDISVRFAKSGESLAALDGKTYSFDDTMTLVCDEAGPEGIGGVMGGEETGCTEGTTDVFIEAAYFDPVRTAATGRKLKINSDARYRFERGVDPASAPDGIELATKLILDLCGGEPSHTVTAGAIPDTARSYTLRASRVETLVGMSVEPAEQRRILEALGFGVTDTDGGFSVAIPSWRPDVHGEADLVEEVARIVSLTGLKSQPLPRGAQGVPKQALTPIQKRLATSRRALADRGMNECVSYTFIDEKHAALFGGGSPRMLLENPISTEMSEMRPSPLPGLLAAASRNQARGFADLALFEIGPGFHGPEPTEQAELACGVRVGSAAGREWSGARRPVDFFDAKADVEALLEALGAPVERLMIDRNVPDWLHPGRSALLKLGPKVTLAAVGELHPKTLSAMDISGNAVAFQIYLEAIPFPKAKTKARPKLVLNDLQPVERDFAFVVDARIEAEAIRKAAKAADKALITGVTVFDVFEGQKAEAQLGAGRKSVAVSVSLQPKDKTFTDADIEAIGEQIVASVVTATGAELRG